MQLQIQIPLQQKGKIQKQKVEKTLLNSIKKFIKLI